MDFKILIIAGETIFIELANAIVYSLQELGHIASISEHERDYGKDATIVIKANRQFNHNLIPGIKILFQTEQLWDVKIRGEYYIGKGWDRVLDMFHYNITGVTGISNVRFCPIGWSPAFEYNLPKVEEDIDVYFYGAQTQRRKEIIDYISNNSPELNIRSSGQDFGVNRESYMNRSKIVLYLKAHERWNYAPLHCLLAQCNKKMVMCEEIDKYSQSCQTYNSGKHFIEFRPDDFYKSVSKWLEPKKREEFTNNIYDDIMVNYKLTKYLNGALEGIIS